MTAWRARAIKMHPSDFRDTSEDVRITLLAALCSSRQAQITDALVDLLVALVHKINARRVRRPARRRPVDHRDPSLRRGPGLWRPRRDRLTESQPPRIIGS